MIRQTYFAGSVDVLGLRCTLINGDSNSIVLDSIVAASQIVKVSKARLNQACNITIQFTFLIMAMDLLPPEVLIIILAHCETLTSAYYFARANCRLYRIWLSCREQLAEPLARHEISLLDNALVIVRTASFHD